MECGLQRQRHFSAQGLFLEALPSVLRASCHASPLTGSLHVALPPLHSFTHFASPSLQRKQPLCGVTCNPTPTNNFFYLLPPEDNKHFKSEGKLDKMNYSKKEILKAEQLTGSRLTFVEVLSLVLTVLLTS